MALTVSALFDPSTLGRNEPLYPLPYDTRPIRLCGRCWYIFEPRVLHDVPDAQWIHQPTMADLERSNDAHCYFCTRIWERLEEWEKVSLENRHSNPYVTTFKVKLHKTESFKIMFRIGPWSEPNLLCFSLVQFRGNLPLCDSAEAEAQIHQKISMTHPTHSGLTISTNPMYQLSKTTGSHDTLHLIKIWMQQCLATHKACKRRFTETGAPRRLIHIDKNDWRLHIMPEEDMSRPPYIALSHCWGTNEAKMPRLTERSQTQYVTGLPITDLPLTFQEAIQITRMLGFEYIWIDSMCILQDSKKDWDEQAIIMSQIYHRAELTICATKAVDGSHGCFTAREPDGITPRRIQISLEPEEPMQDYLVIDESYLKARVLNAALNLRGWVIQERFTSRRTLHFTSEQVYWECSERQACEVYPSSIPSAMMDAYNRSFQQGLEQAFVISELFDDGPDGIWPKEWAKRAIYLMWRGIVCQYMARKLTKPKDKLPAIRSLAEIFGVVTKDTYEFGIWVDDIPYGLLWQVDLRRGDTVKPDFYRAPSWSWASLDATIRDYWVKSAKGRLDDLDGTHIREIQFLINPDEDDLTDIQRKIWLRLEGEIFKLHIGHIVLSQYVNRIEVMADRIYLYPDQRSFVDNGRLFFLPILHTVDASEVCDNNNYCFRGLLLITSTATDPAPNEFMRVGCAYVIGEEVMETIQHSRNKTHVDGFGSMLEYVSHQEIHIA